MVSFPLFNFNYAKRFYFSKVKYVNLDKTSQCSDYEKAIFKQLTCQNNHN